MLFMIIVDKSFIMTKNNVLMAILSIFITYAMFLFFPSPVAAQEYTEYIQKSWSSGAHLTWVGKNTLPPGA